MPILSSQSGISAKAFGLTSSQFSSFGNGYWGQILSKTGGSSYNPAYSAATDSSDNIYFGSYYTEANMESCIIKTNSSGVIQWQKKISTPQSDTTYGSTVDSSDNLIVTGISGTLNSGYVARFDSTGTLLWAKEFVGSYTSVSSLAVKTDSSNNIYLSGVSYTGTTNTFDGFVVKLNSSGTVQWQRFLGSINFESFQGVAVDSSGNVYASGYTSGGTYTTSLLVKYNSSGVLQWQKEITYSLGGNATGGRLAFDSSNNIYWAGFGATYGHLIKFDSAGNTIWQKRGNSLYTNWTDIHIDSSDNIYVYGTVYDGANFIGIVKYDTSGNVIYRRKLSGFVPGGIFVKGSDMYILGRSVIAVESIGLYKLPSDGSKTGIYQIGTNTVLYNGYDDQNFNGLMSISAGTEVDSAGNFAFTTSPATITTDTFTQTIQY